MKKILLIVFLCSILLLIGCESSNDKVTPFSKNGQYTYMMVQNDDAIGAVLCRFNIDTGNVTSFCNSMEFIDGRIVLDYGAIVQDSYWKVDSWNGKGGGKVVIDTKTDEVTLFECTWNMPV